ncbi:MAG: hypothetical protein CVV50_04675 [Spirochaetae bacterium HGW-Spirochaetae-6]|nr:MAG: hypothetical protein CVV50_04675 [Spirochaetae bacterium HGW-Spirochaetae-6]
MANINIFIISYLNINIGPEFLRHWFFKLFMGGFSQAFYIFLVPRIAFYFLYDEIPRERKILFDILAALAFIKVIPALFREDYEFISKILGDIFIFLVLMEVTVHCIKMFPNMKSVLKKKIGFQGLLFLWGLFLFSFAKYWNRPETIGGTLILGWGIQLFFFGFALAILTKTIKAYLKSHDSEEALTGSELTNREQDIVRLVLKGISNREIAGKIYVSENTVKKHLQNIYQKLGINSKLQLLSRFKDHD